MFTTLTANLALPAGAHTAPSESTPESTPQSTPQKEYPPTPIKFPHFRPQDERHELQQDTPVVSLLQKIQRPADIKPHHFSALGIHITPDCPASVLLPDASYLPPLEQWAAVPQEDLESLNESTQRPLSNGRPSPGIKTYCERLNELQITNLAAFRTIRRIPVATGETRARLGNAYEFFKNLEFFSGYWPDTSLECAPEIDESIPTHQQTHIRTGTGSQLPPDYRQNLLSAFVKLVAYDFGCNVSFPRTEPRLHLTPPEPAPPSYFNSSVTFIYRTPTDRISARGGVVEGPVAALSSRNTTGFTTDEDEQLDLAREVVAVLLTAQQRAREKKVERRFGEGKWWTTKQRWGGGAGGPIGKEGDKIEALAALAFSKEKENRPTTPPTSDSAPSASVPTPAPSSEVLAPTTTESRVVSESKRQLSSISSSLLSSPPSSSSSSSAKPSAPKRSKKDSGHMPAYDLYRKILPPAPTWDRKARYSAIGSVPGTNYDDIFLVCALNHHISILRARIPLSLISHLENLGQKAEEREGEGGEGIKMYRSAWFDMFIPTERIEAMGLVWGMMAWLMRKVEVLPEVPHMVVQTHLPRSRHDTHVDASNAEDGDKMDCSQ